MAQRLRSEKFPKRKINFTPGPHHFSFNFISYVLLVKSFHSPADYNVVDPFAVCMKHSLIVVQNRFSLVQCIRTMSIDWLRPMQDGFGNCSAFSSHTCTWRAETLSWLVFSRVWVSYFVFQDFLCYVCSVFIVQLLPNKLLFFVFRLASYSVFRKRNDIHFKVNSVSLAPQSIQFLHNIYPQNTSQPTKKIKQQQTNVCVLLLL